MSEKNISDMTDEELIEYYHKCKHLSVEYDVRQLVKKISINSLYGALGNAFFRYSNTKMAAAVTTTGQMVIKTSAKVINKYVNDLLKHKEDEQVDYTIAGDTDSVKHQSLLRVSGKKITIGDFYDTLPNNFIKYDKLSNNYIKEVHGKTVLSVDKKRNLVETPIKYIMKHKVQKRMFRLKIDGHEVSVTQDHSLIVLRNDMLVPMKPEELMKGDKIMYVQEI